MKWCYVMTENFSYTLCSDCRFSFSNQIFWRRTVHTDVCRWSGQICEFQHEFQYEFQHFHHSGFDIVVVCRVASDAKDSLKSNFTNRNVRICRNTIGIAFQTTSIWLWIWLAEIRFHVFFCCQDFQKSILIQSGCAKKNRFRLPVNGLVTSQK